ncbi:MAG: DUF4124 domain-containing protein [Halothiobacillus sp.]
MSHMQPRLPKPRPKTLRIHLFNRVKAAASILSVLACIVPSVQAETIYKYTNSQGDTVFTDQPTQGAQKIIIDPPPVIPLTPINLPPSPPIPPAAIPNAPLAPSIQMHPTPQAETPAPAPANIPMTPSAPAPVSTQVDPQLTPNGHYQSLAITEPLSGPVVAREGGTIFVQVKLTPALDIGAGDRMRILIDGDTRIDDSTGQRFLLNDMRNGPHSIIAVIMRHGQNIFQSNPVNITLAGGR